MDRFKATAVKAPKMIIDAKTARAIKRMDMSQLNAYLYKVRLQGYDAGFKDGLKTREAIDEIKNVVSILGTREESDDAAGN